MFKLLVVIFHSEFHGWICYAVSNIFKKDKLKHNYFDQNLQNKFYAFRNSRPVCRVNAELERDLGEDES